MEKDLREKFKEEIQKHMAYPDKTALKIADEFIALLSVPVGWAKIIYDTDKDSKGIGKVLYQIAKDTSDKCLLAHNSIIAEKEKELSAIKKLADNYDEFGEIFDPECVLPDLADRIANIIAEILGRGKEKGKEFEQLRKKYEESSESSGYSILRLKDTIKAKDKEIAELKESYRDEQQRCQDYAATIALQDEEIEKLKAKDSEIAESHDLNTSQAKKISELNAEIARLRRALKEISYKDCELRCFDIAHRALKG